MRAGEPIEVHYRFYSASAQRAAAMLAESRPDPVLEHPMVRCPAFEENGINSFDPCVEYRQPSDRWFWQCSDRNCHWDWETGFRTPGSLMIARDSSCCTPEYTDAPWLDMYPFVSDGSESSQWILPRLPGDGDLRITAMVRTVDLQGDVFMAVQRKATTRTGNQDMEPVMSEGCRSGSMDWTEITLDAKLPNSGSRAPVGLFLVLRGTGTCWFDEVRVQRR